MNQELDILEDFVDILNGDYYIGDMKIVDAFYDDYGIDITIQSGHDVVSRSNDEYNVFQDYINQYFSSIDWMSHLINSKAVFQKNVNDIAEEMNIDYHDNWLSESVFAIKGEIFKDLQEYANQRIDNFEENYDNEDGVENIKELNAWDYSINIGLKEVNLFPTTWLLEKFDNDKKFKFSKNTQGYVYDYTDSINGSSRLNNSIFITLASSQTDFVNVNAQLYKERNLSSDLKSYIEYLYSTNDWEKLVKGGLFAPKSSDIANKWNKELYEYTLDSETWNDFKKEIKKDFDNIAYKLFENNKIDEDTRDEMLDIEFKFNLNSVNLFNAVDLGYKASEQRRKNNR